MVSVSSDSAPCRYTVEVAGTELSCGPINPPVSLRPRGMNNLGYWVGLRNFCGQINSAELPIMWTPQSGAQALPTPPQTDTCVATSVNDLGAVAGSRNGWTACALNDRGQVLCSGGGAAIGPHGCAWIMSPNSPLGDLNGDCRVDGADIAILLQAWGSSTPAQADADLNHDGLVGGPDLGMLLGSWSPGR